MTLTFVTGNENKLKEVKALLGDSVTSQSIDLPELQGSYAEIIAHKAQGAAELVKGPVLVEDTALEFNAFGKELPGPYIKWFLRELRPEGMSKLLAGFEDKTGSAVCTAGYCAGPGQPVKVFTGKTHGKIVPPQGPQNFGWDCCFQPDGFDQTYAEMEKQQKNKISHRGKAMSQVKQWLESQ